MFFCGSGEETWSRNFSSLPVQGENENYTWEKGGCFFGVFFVGKGGFGVKGGDNSFGSSITASFFWSELKGLEISSKQIRKQKNKKSLVFLVQKFELCLKYIP